MIRITGKYKKQDHMGSLDLGGHSGDEEDIIDKHGGGRIDRTW